METTVLIQLPRDMVNALLDRSDLLESECEIVQEERITWNGRKRMMSGFGTTGGSSADRMLIIDAMALIETARDNNRGWGW
jgi:hypothetical protein